MVRMSEHASAENSRAYRLSVGAFAMLGYAWVLGCMVLGAGLVGWAGLQLLQGRLRFDRIPALIEATLAQLPKRELDTIEAVLEFDRLARDRAESLLAGEGA